jgi:hypothetical protein
MLQATIGNMLPATFFSMLPVITWCKAAFTSRQQLATCCLQHFLVMTGNITKKCCRQHIANCCLGVRPPLHQGNNWQYVACNIF